MRGVVIREQDTPMLGSCFVYLVKSLNFTNYSIFSALCFLFLVIFGKQTKTNTPPPYF